MGCAHAPAATLSWSSWRTRALCFLVVVSFCSFLVTLHLSTHIAARSKQNQHIVVSEIASNVGVHRSSRSTASEWTSNLSVKTSPILQFLFLVQDKINYEKLWVGFLAAAPKDAYRVHVHCTDRIACERNLGAPFQNAIIPLARSEWCNDLATVMNALLRAGLDSIAEDGPPVQEVFVFISGTTIPVKPFPIVYHRLVSPNASSFCVNPPFHWASCKDVSMGSAAFAVKHHQWIVLTREHARLALRYLESHTFGTTPLKLPGAAWVSEHEMCSMRGCLDEFWHFTALFGLVWAGIQSTKIDVVKDSYWHEFPGIVGGGLWVPLDFSNPRGIIDVQGGCWTYVFWGLGAAPLFSATSRKLVETTVFDLQKLPGIFKRLDVAALMVLRQSPFLFARKFQENFTQVIGSMEQILLGDTL